MIDNEFLLSLTAELQYLGEKLGLKDLTISFSVRESLSGYSYLNVRLSGFDSENEYLNYERAFSVEEVSKSDVNLTDFMIKTFSNYIKQKAQNKE